MPKAKTTNGEKVDSKTMDKCANMLKAMAHPIRMSIIDLLKNSDKLSVTQIYEALRLEQAVASHHLGILRDKGVLEYERDGKNTYYFLEKPELVEVLNIVQKNI